MPENADGPDGGCVPAEGEVVNQVAVGWLLAHQAAQGNHLLPLHINPSQTQFFLSFWAQKYKSHKTYSSSGSRANFEYFFIVSIFPKVQKVKNGNLS